jgi:hypothetical protein
MEIPVIKMNTVMMTTDKETTMTTVQLLNRVKDLRDEKSRMYDSELQILLAEVVSHLETVRDIECVYDDLVPVEAKQLEA